MYVTQHNHRLGIGYPVSSTLALDQHTCTCTAATCNVPSDINCFSSLDDLTGCRRCYDKGRMGFVQITMDCPKIQGNRKQDPPHTAVGKSGEEEIPRCIAFRITTHLISIHWTMYCSIYLTTMIEEIVYLTLRRRSRVKGEKNDASSMVDICMCNGRCVVFILIVQVGEVRWAFL